MLVEVERPSDDEGVRVLVDGPISAVAPAPSVDEIFSRMRAERETAGSTTEEVPSATPSSDDGVPTEETVADGVRVAQPGHFCWEITRDVVTEVVTVDEAQVYEGILFLAEEARLVAEGAGALGVAALLTPAIRKKLEDVGVRPGARVVVLVTGGNIDPLTLYRVIGQHLPQAES